MKLIADCHVHTNFSGDSTSSMESMIEQGIKNGLSYICFTDHMDYDYPEQYLENGCQFEFDVDAYFSKIQAMQKKYKDQINILAGIELGIQPHLADRLENLVSSYPFDFVIGSSHVVHGVDPYYLKFYEGRSEKAAYREYFESILENIQAFDGFDVYGHIDYVVRYGPTKNTNYIWTEYQDIIDEILKLLISKGKGIEINTGGFKYGLGHPNPTEEILARYHELGGEIITIGADAHAPEHVAFDFEKIPDILKNAGFDYFTVFKKRKPEFIKL